MKKALIVVLALAMILSMFCASAEVITFAFAGAADMAGNVIEADLSAYEGATMTIDDEAMTMVFFDGASEANYTLTAVEQTENALVMTAAGDDGEFTIVYAVTEDGTKGVSLIAGEDLQLIFG